MSFAIAAIIIAISLYLLRVWQKSTNAVCSSPRRLDGVTALVTGGTCGMGREAAAELARRGARVLVAGPCEQEGLRARAHIEQQSGSSAVEFHRLELGSLRDVRRFAAELRARETSLQLLVNNAGVGVPADELTPDRLSRVMQINYYGHFLLTLLLLPLLRASAPSRVVNVSSVLHYIGKYDANVNRTNYWPKIQIYGNSKLALILFSRALAKRLSGSAVIINNVDPGAVGTGIFDSIGVKAFSDIIQWFFKGFFKTPWEGAQTILHAAIDDSVESHSGELFKNCKLIRGLSAAYDAELAERVWNDSVELVGLSDDDVSDCLSLSECSSKRHLLC